MIGVKQKFRNIWFWILIIILNVGVVFSLINQLIAGKPVGENPTPTSGLAIGCAVCLGVMLLLKIMYLKVDISETELSIQYFPFFTKRIAKSEISSITPVTYSPLRDYRGWGIRYGRGGMAYTIDGNSGLDLLLVSGKKIMVGIGEADKDIWISKSK